MRTGGLCAVFATAALGATQQALANTWNVGCPGAGATTLSVTYVGGAMDGTTSSMLDFAADDGTDAALDALGALLGTPAQRTASTIATSFGVTLSTGDTVKITGSCQQDVTITTPGLRITNATGSGSDGVQGQIEVAGARQTVINGLLVGPNMNSGSFASAADQALVYAHDGASAIVQNSSLANSPRVGAFAANASQVLLLDTFIGGSGASVPDFEFGVGALAIDGSSLVIDLPDSNPTTTEIVSNHGGGIALFNGSSLVSTSAVVSTEIIHANDGRQLFLTGGSSARLTGTHVGGDECDTHCGSSIEAVGASSLRLDGLTSIGAVAGQSAVTLSGSSTLLASGTLMIVPAGAATIEASYNSVVALAGGNTICNGSFNGSTCIDSTGTAFQIDHVSTLIDVPPEDFGYTAGQDAVFGGGTVQLQSTVDLGLGTVGGSTPSLAWNTGSGAIAISQNSSFRLDGGATVTGKVKLSQGSNGFFNVANGGTNTVTGGVSCPFTAMPAAHVVAPNASALSPTPDLAIGFLSATANQCLPF